MDFIFMDAQYVLCIHFGTGRTIQHVQMNSDFTWSLPFDSNLQKHGSLDKQRGRQILVVGRFHRRHG